LLTILLLVRKLKESTLYGYFMLSRRE